MVFAGAPARRAGQGESPRFQSRTGTLGTWGTNAPDDFDWSGDDDGRFPVTRLRQQYIDYLATKVDEYEEQKQARHYYNAAHWTHEEIRILRARRQPIITFNRIGRKIDSIVGLVQRFRQEPKAYPRHPSQAQGADIATQCLRAALDGMDFAALDFQICRQAAIEGIGGIELKLTEGDHQDPDITGDFIFGDDFFYDPRSFKPDFSDSRWMGIAKWLDVEAAIELFPDKEHELRTLMVDTGFDLTTHADREFKWVYVNEQRLRLVEHWYKHRGKWFWSFYCSNMELAHGVSPFLDERNRPMNRFVMFSAAVDHDGDRYGFVRNLKGPQDEINQRRSKMLHISNTSRVFARKGSVDDVETARREMMKPDGWVEVNPGFDLPQETQKAENLAAQGELYQSATLEVDSFANINPALMTQDDDHSGKAINLLQKAGIAEIGSFVLYYKQWKHRVYRAVWNIISREWQNERWIRVSGQDSKIPQFLQLNAPQPGMINQWGQPVIINAIGSLDVDIVLDDGPDTPNLLMEAYEMVKDDPSVPWPIKLMLMPMSQEMKDKIDQMQQQAAQQQKPDPQTQAKIQTEQIKQQGMQAKNQTELAREHMAAQADAAQSQAEVQSRMQDLAIQREKAQAERQKIHLEMVQATQEHAFRMQELREQARTRFEQHAQKRAEARRRPKQAAAR